MLRNDKRIESVRLVEIGPFADCEMVFQKNKNPKLAEVHIFTGGNGCGKSTVLYCLAAMFGNPAYPNQAPFSEALKRFRGKNSKAIAAKFSGFLELCYSDRPTHPDAGVVATPHHEFHAFTTRMKAERKELFDLYAATQRTDWRTILANFLPLAYSGRRSFNSAPELAGIDSNNTSPALANHLNFEKSIDFVAISKWILEIEVKEALALKRGDASKAADLRFSLDTVTQVINEITSDNLKFVLDKNLSVLIKRGDTTLSFDVLPDGLKSIISWIADVLMRMDRLPWENPDVPLLEQPLILFLDEIDIHLHPKWQRKVLPVVQKLFPNAQIFVSTHSPFVVGSVQDAWVYKLDDAKTKQTIEGIPSGAGTSYEVLLEEIFDVSEHYDVETQRLLAEMKTARNALLADKSVSPHAFKTIAQTLAARSEELDGIVATELRQLAKHGRTITLDPVAA
jgi:energy-coupling factor transporter ATP-binding protein EcfA2